MSENTDRSERMTGTPSKDRAEAHRADAQVVLAKIGLPAGHESDVAIIAGALATSFAEGMKRAAEIAQAKEAEYDGYVRRAADRDLPNGVDAEKRDVARSIRCIILSEAERR